ncbi:hypothetical protein JZ751_017979 [Albula glossodonta]|uniref:Uncharacterized protein n=1 Tax=Albula glossodonta TaxID=121402 RepID=A0A8T2PPV5_9TELE|nr:hypothetical protein JZ751_017979 [Albula glossodonta]
MWSGRLRYAVGGNSGVELLGGPWFVVKRDETNVLLVWHHCKVWKVSDCALNCRVEVRQNEDRMGKVRWNPAPRAGFKLKGYGTRDDGDSNITDNRCIR